MGKHKTEDNERDDVGEIVPEPITEVVDPSARVTLGRF